MQAEGALTPAPQGLASTSLRLHRPPPPQASTGLGGVSINVLMQYTSPPGLVGVRLWRPIVSRETKTD